MDLLKITLFQAYIFWENVEKNLQNIDLKFTEIRESTDLIILPEMFNTGFTMNVEEFAEEMDGKTITWMKEKAHYFNAVITGSLIIIENGNYFNRLIWMHPDGSYEKYDKKHLFGMAEEDKLFTAGSERLIVDLKGWKIMPVICYDLRFPIWLRNKSEEYYDMILIVANWPEQRAHHWRNLIPARAIENQSYIIALNRVGHDGNQIYYSGETTCLDPQGNVVYYKRDEQDLYTLTLNKDEVGIARESLPFLKDADDFTLK